MASLNMRSQQDNFIDLVDCLLGPTGGYKLSLDYGANFEARSFCIFLRLVPPTRKLSSCAGQGLAHSLSVDGDNDGIFVPPIPHDCCTCVGKS